MERANPINVTIKADKPPTIYITDQRPAHCDFLLRGIKWEINEHEDCLLSTQESTFLDNHLQLVEMSVYHEVALDLNIQKPSVFMVVMLEGFYRYYREELLNFYAVGGAMYMLYCPQTTLELRVNKGKHSLLVIDIGKQLLQDVGKSDTKLISLINSLFDYSQELSTVPMCRNDRQITTFLNTLRMLKVDSFVREAELAILLADLLKGYSAKLENDSFIKSQLSPELANKIFVYVQENFNNDGRLSITAIARTMGISEWKMKEYAQLLFGKSLHKQVRDLRMRVVVSLLKKTNMLVRSIAESVGYTTPTYFYRAFRSCFGISPQRYRESSRETDPD